MAVRRPKTRLNDFFDVAVVVAVPLANAAPLYVLLFATRSIGSHASTWKLGNTLRVSRLTIALLKGRSTARDARGIVSRDLCPRPAQRGSQAGRVAMDADALTAAVARRLLAWVVQPFQQGQASGICVKEG